MKAWLAWLEDRTGCGRLGRRLFYEALPGGASWRRAWLATLAFTFLVQVVTGFFLLPGYSASTQTAWESVFHLQFQTAGGWVLRGLHVVAAQVFVVLLGLHLMQVVVSRAYLAPRELNLWLLLVLLPLAIAQSVTGWLLPFDQKGFWAARVPLNILGVVPGVGPLLQQVLIGGAEVGHHTLTRFLALHATALPLAIGALLAALCALPWREAAAGPVGAAAPEPATGAGATPRAARWWPDQALRDAVACLAVLVTILFFVLRPRWGGSAEPFPELLAPADPTEPFAAARPEWFMLFLFQFLKYFPAGTEVWGAVVIPTLIFLVIAAMPWIGRWRLGPRFNTAFLLALALGALALGARAVWEDRHNPHYLAAVRAARAAGERARALASGGIPAGGALELVRADPWLQGPKLFARHCASCHRYAGHDGLGGQPAEAPSASDLAGFASREWLAGLLDPARVAGPHYFGGTRFADGKMARFVQREVAGFDAEQRAKLAKVIAAVSAEAGLKAQAEADARDAALIAEGRELIRSREMKCTSCHQFREPDEDATAPDLTGYGARAWLVAFIGDPAHARFYGRRNDRMPRFATEGVLSEREIGLLADWLRGEWPEPVAP
jgi:ubiquinol-cytochrome c reductase cytochrome b subunit